MLNLNDLHLFVIAVDAGSFAAAARRLGLPKSTVSKRVAELEKRLDARLIHRTSRSFALTELGREFHEHARAALLEAEAAESLVRTRLDLPSGRVRLTASVPVAQEILAPALPRLARLYPRLEILLDVSDRFVDLVHEGYDIALRSHAQPLPDSGLVQRRLAVEPVILVAAPDYLTAAAPPLRPADLAAHAGLLSGPGNGTWSLTADGTAQAVTPRARFIANETSVLLGAALAGLGIVCLPERTCRPALTAGLLRRVLPDWEAGQIATTLLMPHRRGLLPGVRATVEFLAGCLD